MNFDEHEFIEAWVLVFVGTAAALIAIITGAWLLITMLRYFGLIN